MYYVVTIATLVTMGLALARALLGPRGGQLITAVALVALLGLINTVVMAAPRILYGLGRDGLLPGVIATVNPGGTPVPALLITTGSFEEAAALLAEPVKRIPQPLRFEALNQWLKALEFAVQGDNADVAKYDAAIADDAVFGFFDGGAFRPSTRL